jgi:putative membrane protein
VTVLVIGFVLAVLAALLHAYIFYLESIAWESDRARAIFRTGSVQEARATRALAFNQGFYNLFLAVLAVLGTVVAAAGAVGIGATLALAGTGSMLAAALVLLLSSPALRGAAVRQGTIPLLAVVSLVVGLLLR